MERSIFYGRWLIFQDNEEIPIWPDLKIRKGIINQVCQRCESRIASEWCIQHVQYCWACAKLGIVTSKTLLLTLAEPNLFNQREVVCKWQGHLTDEQETVSKAMLAALAAKESHLTYAVTGAGKTEMIFPMLTQALNNGQRIAIVSPRIDVILELAPRINKAFDVPIVVLYGASKETYQYEQLVLATTHQLLKFYHAFDVIIIDEVDAFPFAENRQLNLAATRAAKLGGIFFYLTATPSQRLQRLVAKGEIRMNLLARRFHGYALPNFKIYQVNNWRCKLPNVVKKLLMKYERTKQQFFIFVPEVIDLMTVYDLVKAQFRGMNIQTTHAADDKRYEKIAQVRSGDVQGLITTTILERGVTIKNLAVFILGADEEVFSKAALIQMAGRSGRSSDFPHGLVLAVVSEKTNKLQQAYNEIKYLNFQGHR